MKTTIQKAAVTAATGAALLALTSCSSEETPGTTVDATRTTMSAPGGSRAGVVIDTVTTTATVQSVNAADRTVVLLHPDGTQTTYECGPDVRNFSQIKAGDQVTATMAEELAIALIKGDVPPAAGTASAIVRAPLGAKPGGKIVDTVGFTARVVSVSVVNRTVTLQMADGTNKTIAVGRDINLANVNPGDHVGVRITRAFAIAVTEPGTAPATPASP